MNGGFRLVLDGSESAAGRARSMLGWDVSNGVARFLLTPIDSADNNHHHNHTRMRCQKWSFASRYHIHKPFFKSNTNLNIDSLNTKKPYDKEFFGLYFTDKML